MGACCSRSGRESYDDHANTEYYVKNREPNLANHHGNTHSSYVRHVEEKHAALSGLEDEFRILKEALKKGFACVSKGATQDLRQVAGLKRDGSGDGELGKLGDLEVKVLQIQLRHRGSGQMPPNLDQRRNVLLSEITHYQQRLQAWLRKHHENGPKVLLQRCVAKTAAIKHEISMLGSDFVSSEHNKRSDLLARITELSQELDDMDFSRLEGDDLATKAELRQERRGLLHTLATLEEQLTQRDGVETTTSSPSAPPLLFEDTPRTTDSASNIDTTKSSHQIRNELLRDQALIS